MGHSITSLTSSSPTPDIKNQASARNSIQFYSGSYAYVETHKDHILFYIHGTMFIRYENHIHDQRDATG
jgi:hypothetical protein